MTDFNVVKRLQSLCNARATATNSNTVKSTQLCTLGSETGLKITRAGANFVPSVWRDSVQGSILALKTRDNRLDIKAGPFHVLTFSHITCACARAHTHTHTFFSSLHHNFHHFNFPHKLASPLLKKKKKVNKYMSLTCDNHTTFCIRHPIF